MDFQIILLLFTLVAAIVLFSTEWFSIDVTALGLLIFLVLTGLLPAEEAFAGFGSDVVILMLGLLIMAAALERTGVTEYIAGFLVRWSGTSANQMMLVVMLVSVAVSAFMSNTAATALFLPIVLGLARRINASPSKLLMPLAFSSILASSITLIGTSTNIIVSGLMERYGMEPLGMFELTPAGIPIALAGVAYMFSIGHRLIPDRTAEDNSRPATYTPRLYLSEVHILPGSPFAGKTLEEAKLGQDYDLTVLRVVRDRQHYHVPVSSLELREGDELLVKGARENILRIQGIAGIELVPDLILNSPDMTPEELSLHEVILLPGSPLIGRTPRGSLFRQRYGLQVLALYRHGESMTQRLSETRLRMGDVLLVQGEAGTIDELDRQGVVSLIGPVEAPQVDPQRALIAASIFGGAILLAGLNVLPLPVAMLTGAVLTLLTRCITPEEAYRKMQWRVLILIASMLGLGAAIEITGTAQFLAQQVIAVLGTTSPFWLLTAFFALTVILTQPMSNQSAAVVVLPIAVQTALQLGLNPRTFAIIIALAASTSFITPLEPACLMVYGPGRYKFFDFVRVGSLLTLLIYGISILAVMALWPVNGP